MNEYANGVDKEYKDFVASNISYFSSSKIPINEFITIMDNFRVYCVRFKQADTQFIIDFCNYTFQCHYNLSNAVKLLKKEERSVQINPKAQDQILFFLKYIFSDSHALNRLKIFTSDGTTEFSIDEFTPPLKNIQKYFKQC